MENSSWAIGRSTNNEYFAGRDARIKSRNPYIFGHLFGAVGVLMGEPGRGSACPRSSNCKMV